MLRKEQLATFVKQNYASAVQIDHLNKSPTSIQTRMYSELKLEIQTLPRQSKPNHPTLPRHTNIK